MTLEKPARADAAALSPRRRVIGCVAAIYFLSGACSLIDEVVWVRLVKLVLGNTVFAASIVVSVFLGGLALGAAVMGRRADRVRRPLRLYAALEAAVTVAALALPWALRAIDGVYVRLGRAWHPSPAAMLPVQVVVSAAVLLVPAMLMGSTLPLLGAFVTSRGDAIGRAVGRLYAVNMLGAAAGVFAAGFVLIRAVGVMGTLYAAAGLNAVVALAALLLSRRSPAAAAAAPAPAAVAPTPPRAGRYLLPAAALTSGLVSIGYEIVWMRSIVHLLGAETYVFSAVLVVYLLGNMIGAGIGSRIARRLARPDAGFAVTLAAVGAGGIVFVPLLLAWSSSAGPALDAWAGRHYVGSPDLVTLGMPLLHCLVLFLLPAVAMGAGFPLALQAWRRQRRQPGRATGGIYGINTIGAVAGGLVTGFVLIPAAGVQLSATLLGLLAVSAAGGLWLSSRPASRAGALAAGATVLLAVAAGVLMPTGLFRRMVRYRDTELLDVREGVTATVSVHREPNGDLWLCSGGLQIAGDRARSVQRMLGHLPVLLHPRARSVLTIGFGSGETTACLARHDLDRIDCVELSPEVVDLSRKHFRHINLGDRLGDRVHLTFTDARNYLHLTARRYDLILTDSINPKYFAENASLYTRQYFRSAAEHLTPDGLAVCWIPFTLPASCFDSILGTFTETFGHTTLWLPATKPGQFVLAVGSQGPQRFSPDRMRDELRRPGVRESLGEIGIHTIDDVLCCYLGDAGDIRRHLPAWTPNDDDRPFVEFSTDPAQTGGAEWRFIAGLIARLQSRSLHDHIDLPDAAPPLRRRWADRLDRLQAIAVQILRVQIAVHAQRLYGPSPALARAIDDAFAPLCAGNLQAELTDYLRDNPDYLTGHAVLGSLLLAADRPAAAAAEFDEVIRLDPGNTLAYKQRARARALAGIGR